MPRHQSADDNAPPVMVPRNDRPLAPVGADRVRRFREHVVKAMHEARALECTATHRPPQPTAFAATVAGVACGLCKGSCCGHGADDAYLDGHTMARVRSDMPELDADAVVRLYLKRVPSVAYEGSCIFQGSDGCTLERSLRADICNNYFCRGLTTFFRDRHEDAPQIVVAGKGNATRSSEVLVPYS
jgi:hypothetical protein